MIDARGFMDELIGGRDLLAVIELQKRTDRETAAADCLLVADLNANRSDLTICESINRAVSEPSFAFATRIGSRGKRAERETEAGEKPTTARRRAG
jgi:hypothetical protein